MNYKLHYTNIDFIYEENNNIRVIKESNTYTESFYYENKKQLYDDLIFEIKQLEGVKVVRRHTNVFNENATSRAVTMTIEEIMKYMHNHRSITFVNIGKNTEYFIIVKIIECEK